MKKHILFLTHNVILKTNNLFVHKRYYALRFLKKKNTIVNSIYNNEFSITNIGGDLKIKNFKKGKVIKNVEENNNDNYNDNDDDVYLLNGKIHHVPKSKKHKAELKINDSTRKKKISEQYKVTRYNEDDKDNNYNKYVDNEKKNFFKEDEKIIMDKNNGEENIHSHKSEKNKNSQNVIMSNLSNDLHDKKKDENLKKSINEKNHNVFNHNEILTREPITTSTNKNKEMKNPMIKAKSQKDSSENEKDNSSDEKKNEIKKEIKTNKEQEKMTTNDKKESDNLNDHNEKRNEKKSSLNQDEKNQDIKTDVYYFLNKLNSEGDKKEVDEFLNYFLLYKNNSSLNIIGNIVSFSFCNMLSEDLKDLKACYYEGVKLSVNTFFSTLQDMDNDQLTKMTNIYLNEYISKMFKILKSNNIHFRFDNLEINTIKLLEIYNVLGLVRNEGKRRKQETVKKFLYQHICVDKKNLALLRSNNKMKFLTNIIRNGATVRMHFLINVSYDFFSINTNTSDVITKTKMKNMDMEFIFENELTNPYYSLQSDETINLQPSGWYLVDVNKILNGNLPYEHIQNN